MTRFTSVTRCTLDAETVGTTCVFTRCRLKMLSRDNDSHVTSFLRMDLLLSVYEQKIYEPVASRPLIRQVGQVRPGSAVFATVALVKIIISTS